MLNFLLALQVCPSIVVVAGGGKQEWKIWDFNCGDILLFSLLFAQNIFLNYQSYACLAVLPQADPKQYPIQLLNKSFSGKRTLRHQSSVRRQLSSPYFCLLASHVLEGKFLQERSLFCGASGPCTSVVSLLVMPFRVVLLGYRYFTQSCVDVTFSVAWLLLVSMGYCFCWCRLVCSILLNLACTVQRPSIIWECPKLLSVCKGLWIVKRFWML